MCRFALKIFSHTQEDVKEALFREPSVVHSGLPFDGGLFSESDFSPSIDCGPLSEALKFARGINFKPEHRHESCVGLSVSHMGRSFSIFGETEIAHSENKPQSMHSHYRLALHDQLQNVLGVSVFGDSHFMLRCFTCLTGGTDHC